MLQTPDTPSPPPRHVGLWTRAALACASLACFMSRAQAHGISEDSRDTMAVGSVVDFIGLGAEHMVTGYDHLLFLFGVVFFLTGFRDVVRFITAFTLGHCITLLGATLAGVTANAYLIDAVIALSVVYKGFENLGGFEKRLGVRTPNLLLMVFVFGLIHGFGLSTRLQELPLGEEGLVSRILAFNVGVELGQVAALSVMLGFFAAWRSTKAFERFGSVVNMGLVLAGVGLFGYQVHGYLGGDDHDHPTAEAAGEDDHGPGPPDAAHPAPEAGHRAGGADRPPERDHDQASAKAGPAPDAHQEREGAHPAPEPRRDPAKPAPQAKQKRAPGPGLEGAGSPKKVEAERHGWRRKPKPKPKHKHKRKHKHGSGKAHSH